MSRPSRKLTIQCIAPTSQRGFTLVELLVVVLILAILMAVALPLYLATLRTSNRRVARTNMKTLTTANTAYRLQKGQFTDSIGDLVTEQIISSATTGPGQTSYSLYKDPITLPDGRSLGTDEIAACGSDTSLGAAGDYGCYIPLKDTD